MILKGFPFSCRSVVMMAMHSRPGARRLLPLNDLYAFQTVTAAAPRGTRWRLLLEIG